MEKEDMVYQRLFNIKYNDKNFTIFIDRYGRRTFLELSDRGNYEYRFILIKSKVFIIIYLLILLEHHFLFIRRKIE